MHVPTAVVQRSDVVLEKELGIVLKRFYPHKQKLAILTRNVGKVEVITDPLRMGQRLWPGTVCSFFLRVTSSKVSIAEAPEILLMPLERGSSHFYWLQNVLELCYYCIPLEMPSRDVFNCIYQTYSFLVHTALEHTEAEWVKKVSLIKVLALVGFYPDAVLMQHVHLFEQWVLGSIDFDKEHQVKFLQDLSHMLAKQELRVIDEWILSCMRAHPYAQWFKTMAFFHHV